MDAHEAGRIERRFEFGDGLLLEIALAAGVKSDVVVLRFDIVELVERDDMDLRAILDDDALRAFGGGTRGSDFGGEFSFAQALLGAFKGAFKAVGAERLQEIVDGVGIERAHGVLIVCRGEDHGGSSVDELENFEAVELGHLDIEEKKVGGVFGAGFHGFESVLAFSSDFDFGMGAEQFAEVGSRELFVVDDHGAEGHGNTLTGICDVGTQRATRLRMRVVVMLSWGWVLAATAVAQDAEPLKVPEATFRAGTDLVALNVSAFDERGQMINGLPKSAFSVSENGVQQTISVFRQEDVPVSLGLIIDVSGSMDKKRERVISSTLAMIRASNPQDEVCSIYFNEAADLVQDFTSDIGLLTRSLRSIRPQGGTAMRDAVLLGIDHMRAYAKRDKRVLVVITDGEDNASYATQRQLAEAARQNNVIVYAIGLLGEEIPRSAIAARRALEELTVATGGRSWFPYDFGDIEAITPEIAHEIRNQYIVGYSPTDATKDGKWRAITVELNVPGATVRTRSGYYARP